LRCISPKRKTRGGHEKAFETRKKRRNCSKTKEGYPRSPPSCRKGKTCTLIIELENLQKKRRTWRAIGGEGKGEDFKRKGNALLKGGFIGPESRRMEKKILPWIPF